MQIPIVDLPVEGVVTVHVGVYTSDGVSRNVIMYANDYEGYKGVVDKSQNKAGIDFEVPVELIRDQENVLTLRFVTLDIDENDHKTKTFTLKTLWIK